MPFEIPEGELQCDVICSSDILLYVSVDCAYLRKSQII